MPVIKVRENEPFDVATDFAALSSRLLSEM